MFKELVPGVLLGAAVLTVNGLAPQVAIAQTAPRVPAECPSNPTWTEGVRFYQVMPLSAAQYRPAKVNRSAANVRRGAGMSHDIVFTLVQGSAVVVTGESWDVGCNQWMRVRIGNEDLWINGYDLTYDVASPPAIGSSTNGGARFPAECPGRPGWTQGVEFYELIPLNPGQYRPAEVVSSVANVRRGPGMSQDIAFTLNQGTRVTITGEAWDQGCNQWMRVRTDFGTFWMHGHTLRNL